MGSQVLNFSVNPINLGAINYDHVTPVHMFEKFSTELSVVMYKKGFLGWLPSNPDGRRKREAIYRLRIPSSKLANRY